MKLGEIVSKLNDLMVKHGTDLEVYFDVEAAAYSVHVVPVDELCCIIDPTGSKEEKAVILHTRQEDVRFHKMDWIKIMSERIIEKKVYNATGVVYGIFWGGGKGSYPATKLRGFSTENELMEEAKKKLKSGSLDSGMGYQKLIGAALEIEEVSTINYNGKSFTNSDHYDIKYIGKLSKLDKDFLDDCLEQYR